MVLDIAVTQQPKSINFKYCELCGIPFDSASHYQMHTIVEHIKQKRKPLPLRLSRIQPETKMYSCGICLKAFSLLDDLLDHMEFNHEPTKTDILTLPFKMSDFYDLTLINKTTGKARLETQGNKNSLKFNEDAKIKTSEPFLKATSCEVKLSLLEDDEDYLNDKGSNIIIKDDTLKEIPLNNNDTTEDSRCISSFDISVINEERTSRFDPTLQFSSATSETTDINNIIISNVCTVSEDDVNSTFVTEAKTLESLALESSDVGKFECPSCKKRFSQIKRMNTHFRMAHGLMKHQCPVCGKKFNSKFYLIRHSAMHLKDKPFACSVCDRTFTRKDKMKEHELRIHNYNRIKQRIKVVTIV